MKTFDNQEFKKFLEWVVRLDKKEICKNIINYNNKIEDIVIVFNINGIEDDYYDIPLKNFDNIEEDILYCLQTELEFVDDDLNIIVDDTETYPNNTLYYIDVYIENRTNNLKLLYGTYYPSGFEMK